MRVMTTERCFIRALSIMDAIIEVCSSTPEIFGGDPFLNLRFNEFIVFKKGKETIT